MLQTQAIEPGILDLIKSLQGKEYLKGFHLAGGSALALYYGHRISIDIVLFSDFSFDTSRLIESLQQDYALQLYYTAYRKNPRNAMNILFVIMVSLMLWLIKTLIKKS